MSPEPHFLSFMTNFPPLFEKLGFNLSTTQLTILQNCFFTLFPLIPPTQYHKPMRKPLLKKQKTKQKSQFYFEKSWNFIFIQLFQFIHPLSRTEAQLSPAYLGLLPSGFTFNLSFTFSRANPYQVPAYNLQWIRVPTNKVQIL